MCKLCMRQSLPASKSASSEARSTPHRGAHTPQTQPRCPHAPRDNGFPCHQPPGRLHPRCATLLNRGAHTPQTQPRCPHAPHDNGFSCHQPQQQNSPTEQHSWKRLGGILHTSWTTMCKLCMRQSSPASRSASSEVRNTPQPRRAHSSDSTSLSTCPT